MPRNDLPQQRGVKMSSPSGRGLYQLAIGGTGLKAHPEFADRAAEKIAELTGVPFRVHPKKFAPLSTTSSSTSTNPSPSSFDRSDSRFV